MKKIFLILSLLGTLSFANMTEWIEDFDEARQMSQEENKPLFIFFEMDKCGVCRFMKNNVLDDGEVFDYLDSHFISYKHNVANKPFPIDFEVFGTPTMYFLDKNGKKLGVEIVGGKKQPQFLKELKKRYKMHEKIE